MTEYLNGVVTEDKIYASMYQYDNAIATAITVINQWEHVLNFQTGECNVNAYSNNTLVVNRSGIHSINYNGTVSNAKDKTFELAISINDTIKEETIQRSLSHVVDEPYPVSGGALLTLNVNDILKLEIRNLSSTDNLTIKHANVRIVKL